MNGWKKYGAWFAGITLLTAMASGCAATNRNVTLHYLPAAPAKGGSGEIWLTGAGTPANGTQTDDGRWIVGTVKDDGKTVGRVRIQTPPGKLILDAADRELTDAGFRVRRVDSLPAGVSRGVEVRVTGMALDEATGVVKSEGTSRLAVSFEIWRNGVKVRKLDYESTISDFAVRDKDRLLSDIWMKSARDIMQHAVPDVIRELGR